MANEIISHSSIIARGDNIKYEFDIYVFFRPHKNIENMFSIRRRKSLKPVFAYFLDNQCSAFGLIEYKLEWLWQDFFDIDLNNMTFEIKDKILGFPDKYKPKLQIYDYKEYMKKSYIKDSDEVEQKILLLKLTFPYQIISYMEQKLDMDKGYSIEEYVRCGLMRENHEFKFPQCPVCYQMTINDINENIHNSNLFTCSNEGCSFNKHGFSSYEYLLDAYKRYYVISSESQKATFDRQFLYQRYLLIKLFKECTKATGTQTFDEFVDKWTKSCVEKYVRP